MKRGLFGAVVLFVVAFATLAGADLQTRRAAYEASVVAPLEAKNPEAAAQFLYAYEPKKRADAGELEAKIAKLIDEEPSPYDSHPKPSDRVRWLRELKSSLPPAATDAHDAWSLFENPEAVQTRMTDDIRENLAAQGLVIPVAPAEAAA